MRVYSREVQQTYVPAKTYVQVFMTAIVIIATNWRSSKCPSNGEWINKPWYIHAMDYYLVIKRNKPMTQVTTVHYDK